MSRYLNGQEKYKGSWIAQAYQHKRELLADKRFWVFVMKNPESNDLPKKFKDVDTVTWQLEKGTSGIPHLQGVVQFLYPKSFTQVRAMAPKGWWSVMYGTIHEAKAYCTKVETRIGGPWAYHPLGQAVLDCLAGLSGDAPLYSGTIQPGMIEGPSRNEEPAPAASIAPVTESTTSVEPPRIEPP